MKQPSHKKVKQRVIVIAVSAIVVLSVVLTLANNKKKINSANTRVDRTAIPVAVSVAQASIAPLSREVHYPAFIEPDQEASVYAQTSGILAELKIELGKRVTKGQVIGKLDTHILEINLESARANLDLAAINQAKMLDDYTRAKDLFEHKAGLEIDMLKAKNNYDNAVNTYSTAQIQVNLIRQQIENTHIVAPISGIVSAHQVKQGEFINPGTPIATISNLTAVKATVYVDQQISYLLKEGQDAAIQVPVLGDQTLAGKVIFISPVADANHNYQIDLRVSNTAGLILKGGTDVQVAFTTLSKQHVLQIPASAVMNDAKEPYAYVATGGKAVIKTIKTGSVQDDTVEILAGLSAGDTVITHGQINLREGSTIHIVN